MGYNGIYIYILYIYTYYGVSRGEFSVFSINTYKLWDLMDTMVIELWCLVGESNIEHADKQNIWNTWKCHTYIYILYIHIIKDDAWLHGLYSPLPICHQVHSHSSGCLGPGLIGIAALEESERSRGDARRWERLAPAGHVGRGRHGAYPGHILRLKKVG